MHTTVTEQLEEVLKKFQNEANPDPRVESVVKFDPLKNGVIVGRRKPIVKESLNHFRLKYLRSDTNNCKIMVDAETGFGKTYDIGLWSHISSNAGFHHLVAVPNAELVNQAKEMISGAFDVEIKTPENVQALKDALKSDKPITIIVTHDLLLGPNNDRKFEDRNGEKPKLWISIDEADSINYRKAFKNMCELDEEYSTTYFTATAKKRIFDRCEKIISPTRSSRRCIASTIKTESVITTTNKREKFYPAVVMNLAFFVIPSVVLLPVVKSYVTAVIGLTSDFWVYSTLINSLYLMISVSIIAIAMAPISWIAIQIIGVESNELFSRFLANTYSLFNKEKSSPAHEYAEKCEETFAYNKLVSTNDLLTSVRWNVQSPVGENALILADDVNSIVNLSFALHGEDNCVYENGKIYTRYDVYNKFEPEGMSYQDYRLKLRESNLINSVKKQYPNPNLTENQILELKEKVDLSNTAGYLKNRVMHAMIDLTLSYLMGDDNIALDRQRREDLGKLVLDVKNKVSNANDNDDGIIDFLKSKDFSEEFAQNRLFPQIKTVINALSTSSNEERRLMVDNWHLSKELHDLMKKKAADGNNQNLCPEEKV